MRHPFQCITVVRRGKDEDLLLLALSHRLLAFGVRLNQASNPSKSLLLPSGLLAHWSGEDVGSKGPIIKLAVSGNKQHVAVVTAEDKAVHVLGLPTLQHVNKRLMPKRPSSLCWTSDDQFILSADKFGDVYSLPLNPTEALKRSDEDVADPPAKKFKPTATDLTVHSGRNRKALENQMRLAEQNTANTRKQLDPSLNLVLGHVSMLTDIQCAQVPAPSGKAMRDYILTADRDEHIRVSRGLPQAYIIENYCFGHTQFVSKLHVSKSNLLVSGGGDDWLGLWDWATGELRSRILLRKPFNIPSGPIAVTGLRSGPEDSTQLLDIICTVEGSPCLVRFCQDLTQKTDEDVSLSCQQIPFHRPVVDVASYEDQAIVALDNNPESDAPSASSNPSYDGKGTIRLHAINFSDEHVEQLTGAGYEGEDIMDKLLDGQGLEVHVDEKDHIKLKELLYNVESLRKRGNEDAEQ